MWLDFSLLDSFLVGASLLDFSLYAGLFIAAFVAATLLPLQSELVLVGLLLAGKNNPAILLAVATFGNVLGSLVNWFLGRFIDRFSNKTWFPVSPEQLARAAKSYQRFGRFSLLLAWMPIIGDPITLIAGVLREPLWSFLILVTIAKFGRYLVLTIATLGF